MNIKLAFKPVAFLFVTFLLFWNINCTDAKAEDTKAAADFTLESIDGNRISLSSYRGKTPVILTFWATWCPYCVAELRQIKDEYLSLRAEGFEVLAVNVQESRAKIKLFVSKEKIVFPVLFDLDGRVSEAYGVKGIPAVFIIDKLGEIKFSGHNIPRNYLRLVK